MDRMKLFIKPNLMWAVIAAGGVVLRLRQFAEHLSFGNDEAAVARNIVDRTFSGLTQPLDYNQGAPILFLFIEKLSIGVFGNRDFVLELFPLLSGLLGIYLFYLIARKFLGLAGLFAVFAFAISSSLIWYSSVVKQYSSDVTVTLLLIYLASHCIDEKVHVRDFLLLGITGTIVIWLSHPASLVLAGIGLVIGFQKLYRKDYTALVWSITLGAIWAVALGIDYFAFLRHLSAQPYLVNFWHAGFLPLPPWSKPKWFLDTYFALLTLSLVYAGIVFSVICFLIFLVGSVSLLGRQRLDALLIISPFVMALVASAFNYPLRSQFLLFLVPLVYLLMAEGLGRIYVWIAGLNRILALVAVAAIFFIVLWPSVIHAKRNFLAPQHLWDMRPVVDFMSRKWNPGDAVLVSGGGETFEYYFSTAGLHASDKIIDTKHRLIRFRFFVDDLEKLKGKDRVWIVFSHFGTGPEYSRYIKYLDKHAQPVDKFQMGYARAYLYDLNPWGVYEGSRKMIASSP